MNVPSYKVFESYRYVCDIDPEDHELYKLGWINILGPDWTDLTHKQQYEKFTDWYRVRYSKLSLALK